MSNGVVNVPVLSRSSLFVDSSHHSDLFSKADLSADFTHSASAETFSPSKMTTNASLSLSIALVDDHRLSKECMVKSFEDVSENVRVVAYETVADFLASDESEVDLVLLSLHANSPAGKSLAEDIVTIAGRSPNVPLVVMSDAVDAHQLKMVRNMLNNGAQGVIPTKSTSISLAVAALRLVKAGGTFTPADFFMPAEAEQANTRSQPSLRTQFTSRQVAVLAHMARGRANKIIAHELQMSESTVKVHVRNIMRKVGATNRTQAVYNARALLWRDDTNPQ